MSVDKELGFDPSDEAKKELARRELARRRLLPFVCRFNPDYQAGWVHKDVCIRLERFSKQVANRESPRLMIFLPPRHGKSTIASQSFPAWHLGHYPRHEYMLCSYSGSLSMSFSRQVRSILRDPMYQNVFKTRLDPDSQSVEAWLTTESGGLVAAGVGGAITGKGAHVLVIDDPVKSYEEANSATSRQNTYDWYTSTAYTRLAPGGGVLVIQTRWHDDDLSGRLIDAMANGADEWEVVEYPAIATHDEKYRLKGEALHPERYGLKQLNSIKRAVGDRDWQALYQQSPVADDGAYYTTQMFPRYRLKDRPPLEDMAIFAVWDLAVGQKDYNDYTVGVVAGLDRNLDVWILDMVRDKLDGFGIVQSMIDVQKTWKPERQGVEKGQILMSIEVFLKLEIEKQNQWDLYYQPITPGKNDKEARGRGTQGLMRAQRIRFPDDDEAPWAAIMVHEMLRFPAGVHDDIPDAMGYIGYIYADMCPVPELEDERPPSWKDKLNKYVVGTEGKARRWQQA